ncbi:MAG: glycosyltransferase [Candidatus Coatesbacteria bacterium]|nr:glycosyltransferase [Candidatus Coatesbacteria bacterium]
MKILFITPSVPDELSRIRSLNHLKALSADHEIVLLSFIKNENRKEKLVPLHKYLYDSYTFLLPAWKSWVNCAIALFSRIPLRVAYYYSQDFTHFLLELLKNQHFDCVIVKRKRLAQYGIYLEKIPNILDLTDATALHYERAKGKGRGLEFLINYEEFPKIKRYEVEAIKKFDLTAVCSRNDKEYLEKISQEALPRIVVVPNVVDTEYYAPDKSLEKNNIILFTGVMKALVNQEAILEFYKLVWNDILKQFPDTQLRIAGPEPPPQIRKLHDNRNVFVTGYVDDLRQEINKATIVISPVNVAAGTRNKILQAMSMQKAVISTKIGAEGLDNLDENNIMLAENIMEFGNFIKSCLRNKEKREIMGQKAREFVMKNYSIDILRKTLNSSIAIALKNHKERC